MVDQGADHNERDTLHSLGNSQALAIILAIFIGLLFAWAISLFLPSYPCHKCI